MKKLKVLLTVALILSASMLSSGCTTLVGAVNDSVQGSKFRKEIEKDTPELNAENSAIVFGSGYFAMTMIQQNPKYKYSVHGAYGKSESGIFTVSNYFVFKPIALNSEMHVYSYTYPVYKGTMTMYGGIAGVDFVLNKPGLVYYDDNDPKHENEKDCLKYILKFYEGTSWEPLIQARLKELK